MIFYLSSIQMPDIQKVVGYSDHYSNTGSVFKWWSEYQTNRWLDNFLPFEYKTNPTVFRSLTVSNSKESSESCSEAVEKFIWSLNPQYTTFMCPPRVSYIE